jgi:hypothetical protein
MKPSNERKLESQIKTAARNIKLLGSRYNAAIRHREALERKLEKVVAANQRKVIGRSKSFGVKFNRRKYINKIKGPKGWVACPGLVRESQRRFATIKEANHHGQRFVEIENHKSYSVFTSKDKVNAYVNWRSGKTNPLIGLKRTNR